PVTRRRSVPEAQRTEGVSPPRASSGRLDGPGFLMPKLETDEAGELAPGTVIDGRYKVVRPIGQGGNGLVYEVEHARTGRRLALKVLLDETGFARLEQEARAASLMKNGHTA